MAGPMKPASLIQANSNEALKKAGLNETSVSNSERQGEGDVTLFFLQEGYVIARTWPEHKYCGCDILFWGSFNKQNAARAELIADFGSRGNDSSLSYIIVTGGMHGVGMWKDDNIIFGPHMNET